MAAVAAHPEATSAELAETLGIGQSTATKRLSALEDAGAVRRIPGGRQSGRRVSDRWVTVDTKPGKPGGADSESRAPSSEGAVGETSSNDVRLGRGELASLVRDYLATRPDESFGSAALGKALGRSQGAISNSLAAMATRGDVVLASDKPRRYRIAEVKR
jgi:DNA-binding transcriptional ArsR family regulator